MSKFPPIPQDMQEQMKGSKPTPKGYISADNKLTPEVVNNAQRILRTQNLGYTEEKVINNTKFFFRCEPHYDNHTSGRVYKWHKGVSVYTPKEDMEVSTKNKPTSSSGLLSSYAPKDLQEFVEKMQSAMEDEIRKLTS